MIDFHGSFLSNTVENVERVSRFFLVHEQGGPTIDQKTWDWGAGVIYAQPGLVRVQMVDPPVCYEFSEPEFGNHAQEYVRFPEHAAGVIGTALKLSRPEFVLEGPGCDRHGGKAILFDHTPTVRVLSQNH